ncbi:MAG TPA: ATP-binding protein, partial [Polyangiaceae bacterium]|nr:ATP-binding protein [Polyangiaceae bacterium]
VLRIRQLVARRPGIAEKILKNLFVPFFTTKQQGTGLGLAISQSIVQAAGGTIEVATQVGTGSRFTVLLPAAEEGVLSLPPPPSRRDAGTALPPLPTLRPPPA